uniref:Bestrophin homolog n=1 Tax=Plectus sambesii TaxID=2011161 RepID=A0A914XH30_9BILA
MTITYTGDVARSRSFNFLKLLLRWKGSLWKVIWCELLLWLFLYALISVIYRIVLTDSQQRTFEAIITFCANYTDFVPLTFILGFFVSLVVSRWWNMYESLGWIDNAAMHIASYIEGADEETVTLRRNLVRYLVLVEAMVFVRISQPVQRRYPDLAALQKAGFINEVEVEAMESIDSPHPKHWLPIFWSMKLIKQARDCGKISHDFFVHDLFLKLKEYRSGLGKICGLLGTPIPLAYTQVVFLAVRSYFFVALFGRQYLQSDSKLTTSEKTERNMIDLYFPFATIIEFFFYVGWMKVAEGLFNPFGGDDDDFEVNELLNRNLQLGLTIVDDAVSKVPAQVRDPFSKTGNDAPFVPAEPPHFHFPLSASSFKRRISSTIAVLPSIIPVSTNGHTKQTAVELIEHPSNQTFT